MSDLKIGDLVARDQVLLLTDGTYSQYGVCGIYRARETFTIQASHHFGKLVPDFDYVKARCDEIPLLELHSGCN